MVVEHLVGLGLLLVSFLLHRAFFRPSDNKASVHHSLLASLDRGLADCQQNHWVRVAGSALSICLMCRLSRGCESWLADSQGCLNFGSEKAALQPDALRYSGD